MSFRGSHSGSEFGYATASIMTMTQKAWAGCSASVLLLGTVGVYSFLKVTHTYLLCTEPAADRFVFDGVEKPLSPQDQGCVIINELGGRHRIEAHFGSKRRIIDIFPRVSDDNSSQLRIKPDSVIPYGDLQFEIVE